MSQSQPRALGQLTRAQWAALQHVGDALARHASELKAVGQRKATLEQRDVGGRQRVGSASNSRRSRTPRTKMWLRRRQRALGKTTDVGALMTRIVR